MGNTVPQLNRAEQWILIATPFVTGLLSSLGSITILYTLMRNKIRHKKTQSVKSRILACICFADALHSLLYSTWTMWIPSEDKYPFETIPGVYGNRASCRARGFLMQVLGNMRQSYSGALALYFVLSLRCNLSETAISKKYEPFMHLWAIIFPISTAFTYFGLELFNASGVGCWIAPYPYLCHLNEEVQCTRGENAYTYAWAFTGIPVVFMDIVIVVCMFLTYQSVKYAYQRAQRPIERAAAAGFIHPDDIEAAKRRYGGKIRQSGIQALLYSATYIFTHFFSFIPVAYEQNHGPARFWMLFLYFLLDPLHGFYNVAIFLRPTIHTIQQREKNGSFLHAVYLAIFYNDEHLDQLSFRFGRPSTEFGGSRSFRLGVLTKKEMNQDSNNNTSELRAEMRETGGNKARKAEETGETSNTG